MESVDKNKQEEREEEEEEKLTFLFEIIMDGDFTLFPNIYWFEQEFIFFLSLIHFLTPEECHLLFMVDQDLRSSEAEPLFPHIIMTVNKKENEKAYISAKQP